MSFKRGIRPRQGSGTDGRPAAGLAHRRGRVSSRSYRQRHGQASGTVESPPSVQAPPRHGTASGCKQAAALAPSRRSSRASRSGTGRGVHRRDHHRRPSPSASRRVGPRTGERARSRSCAAASSSASAPWSGSCQSKLASWRGTGAGGQLQAVVTAVTIMLQAATSRSRACRRAPPRRPGDRLPASGHVAGRSPGGLRRTSIPACVSARTWPGTAADANWPRRRRATRTPSLRSAARSSRPRSEYPGWDHGLQSLGGVRRPPPRESIRQQMTGVRSGLRRQAAARGPGNA